MLNDKLHPGTGGMLFAHGYKKLPGMTGLSAVIHKGGVGEVPVVQYDVQGDGGVDQDCIILPAVL